MKVLFLIFSFIISGAAFASSTRIEDADQIRSSDHTKIHSFPTTSSTLARTDAAQTFTGTQTFSSTISGSINGNSATVTTIPTLSGEVSNTGNAITLSNASVIGKLLTGYSSGAGTISSSDSILSAIQKLNGNIAAGTVNLTGPITSVGNATSIASQTGTGTTFVMNTGPTITNASLVTAALGTPASGIMTNTTQIPIAVQIVRDAFSGNSSTTVFTLSFTPAINAQVEIFVNGILQTITTDYSISGTSLTFVAAPTTGQDIKAIYSKY